MGTDNTQKAEKKSGWRERRSAGKRRLEKWGHTLLGRAVSYGILVLYPALLFYVTAYMTYDPFERTRWRAQLLNVALLEGGVWLLIALTGSAVAALRTELVLGMVCSLANYYVLSFRGSPIVPWDILSLGTAASVAGGYSYELPMRQVLLLLLMLFMVATAGFAQVHISGKNRRGLMVRLASGLLSLCCLAGVTLAVQDDDCADRLQLYPFLFTPTVMYERNGFLVTFLMDLQYLAVEKPEGYSPERAQEILSGYGGADWDRVTGDGADADVAADELPNVIVVMDEAFSDLTVLNGGQELPVSRDATPFLHSLQEGADNTVTGSLAVSVKGGNTANTEFEFLTGQTMAFLPAGSIPYQQYVKEDVPALGHYFRQLGYDTYGMHPYYASGWNRETVYPYLGLETFLSLPDYPAGSRVRGYVDDGACMEKIIEIYEERQEQGITAPFFCFAVTMQNHSPYTDGWVSPEGNISWLGSGAAGGVSGVSGAGASGSATQLEEYLTLTELSDRALEELISYFSQTEEPTVIVFFGDHQPTDSVVEPIWTMQGKSGSELSAEDQQARYEVPYVIWANYDIPEGMGQDTSANYLAADMMAAAGIPLADYQNYLLELQEQLPVISAQQPGTESGDDEGSRAEEARLEYQIVQYYLLFDAAEQGRD